MVELANSETIYMGRKCHSSKFGLMDKDLVQFIVHDHDIFPDQITIGAKLWVVPWEKMVSKIIIKK